MLVDLKKLDYFSDPTSVLFNLRTTLEECSQKQRRDSLTKLQKHSLRDPVSRLSNRNADEASSPRIGGGKLQASLRSDCSPHASSPGSRRTSLYDSTSPKNCSSFLQGADLANSNLQVQAAVEHQNFSLALVASP